MAGEPEPGGGAGVPLAQRAATLVATLAHSLTAAIGMAPAVLPVLPWVLAFNVWQALAGLLAAKPAVLLGTAVLLLGALLLAAMLWIMWATFGVLQRSLTFDAAFAAQVAALQVSCGANGLWQSPAWDCLAAWHAARPRWCMGVDHLPSLGKPFPARPNSP